MSNAVFRATDTFGFQAFLAESSFLRPSSPPPATTAPCKFPVELRRNLAMRLEGRDCLNFALVCKSNYAALEQELSSARLQRDARRVCDLAGFMALIGDTTREGDPDRDCIMRLPANLQRAPLRSLARSIVALPLNQQAVAAAIWRYTADPHILQSPMLRQELMEQAMSARLADHVADVHTLDDFRALIGVRTPASRGMVNTIGDLRPDLRIKPLTALATRITRLPQRERYDAVRLWLAATTQIDKRLRAGLERLEREARITFFAATDMHRLALFTAVKSGEAVQDVVTRAGITEPSLTRTLEFLAIGVAMKRGAPLHFAAIKYGIEDAAQLAEATRIAALGDIEFGESLQTVIDTYGMTDAALLRELARAAMREAEHAMLNGEESLPTVIERYGITDAHDLASLTATAIGEAREAIQEGDALETVLARYGITEEEHVAALTRFRDEEEGHWYAQFISISDCVTGIM